MRDESSEFDPRRMLRRLADRANWIIATIIVVHVIVFGFAIGVTPTYKASTEILLETDSTESLATGVLSRGQGAGAGNVDRRETEIRVLLGARVSAVVHASVQDPAAVVATPVFAADAIIVEARSPSPRKAAETANAYAAAYVKVRRDQVIEDLRAAAGRLRIRTQELRDQIADLDTLLADQTLTARRRATASDERTRLLHESTAFQSQLDAFEIDAQNRGSGAAINRAAQTPRSPSGRHPVRDIALGLPLGIMAGVAVALIRDALDNRVRDREDLARSGAGPLLSDLPPITGRVPFLLALRAPKSTFAERFRSLRTGLQFLSVGQELRVIQVTSAAPGEGKTLVAVNLAVSLAETGKRVVLLDGDLRLSSINAAVSDDQSDRRPGAGLSTFLLEPTGSEPRYVIPDEALPLAILPAGVEPPNAAELLASNHMRALMAKLRHDFDYVVIDSPPMLLVADSILLSQYADGIIVVTRAGRTTYRQLRLAMGGLRGAAAPVLGFVLNSAPELNKGGEVLHTRASARNNGKHRIRRRTRRQPRMAQG